ncbi:MAG: hypothetical protein AAGF26_07360 [Cyanobacteria bacterium P01_G01_bin.49]
MIRKHKWRSLFKTIHTFSICCQYETSNDYLDQVCQHFPSKLSFMIRGILMWLYVI